jgi:transposase
VREMNLVELTQHTQSEVAAEDYLRKIGVLQKFVECPYCKGDRFGKIRRGLFKCYPCRKEWSRRRGSRFEESRFPLQKVLFAIKLFELEPSVRKASQQLELAYNATYSLYNLIRQIIIHHTIKNNGSPVRLKLMKANLAGGETVNAAGELLIRS